MPSLPPNATATDVRIAALEGRIAELESALSISSGRVLFKSGSASIELKKDGTVLITGRDITIRAAGKLTSHALGEVTVRGSKISQN